MGSILSLEPEGIENRIHPQALEHFRKFQADVQFEVPLEELTEADLDAYLEDFEKPKFQDYMNQIKYWLGTCIDIGDADSNDNQTKILLFKLQTTIPMYQVKSLLRRVSDQKLKKVREKERKEAEEAREKQRREEEQERQRAAKAKEEQRRREEAAEAERMEREAEERWSAARKAVKPPIDAAKRYLDRPGEYDEFIQAAREAIEVYQEKGEDYLDDSRTFDYRGWLWKINYGKEEEQIRNHAQAQAQVFRARLDQGLKEIEKMLSPKKEDPAVIFKRWCSNNGENRYLGEPFTDILASDDDRNRKWTQGYIPAAEAKLQQSIPEELRDFILTQPTAAFFLLPSAHYAYYGVPCLDFNFAVFAVVTITVSAQAWYKVFNGHKFNFLTNLREPKHLGFYQTTVIPNQSHFWQSVPLTILCALVDGNLQPPGTTILQRTDRLTVYEVKKFEEDICEIPISFERYCRSLGSVEKMKEAQIIKERTAEILEPLQPISINHKESKSKKAKAFELFNEGKRPSDSEVRTLGIKPTSAYRYYQQWKKASYSR